MWKLQQRTVIGQATTTQQAGVLLHPTQELIVLYSLDAAQTGPAFLTYFQDQLQTASFDSTLELHQVLDRCVATAERMEVKLSLLVLAVLEAQLVLAARHGVVWLRRGVKVGQILSASEQLQLLEGKPHPDDVYVLFTAAALPLVPLVQTSLAELSPPAATQLFASGELTTAIEAAADQALIGITVTTLSHTPTDTANLPLHQPTQSTVQTVAEVHQAAETSAATPFQQLRSGLAQVWKKAGAALNWVGQQMEQLFSSDVYVRHQQRRSVVKVILGILVVLAVISGSFVFYQRQQQARQRQVQTSLAPYQERLAQVRTQSLQDLVAARASLAQLITELEAASQDQASPAFVRTALGGELATMREFQLQISGQTALPRLPTFFDLRLVQSNFLASRVEIAAETLFFLDTDQRKVLALNIERKQPTLLPIGDYPEIRALVADQSYLYFLSQGLYRFTLSGTEVASLVKNVDEVIRGGQSIGLFDRYLYVLNRERNNIFRYDTSDTQLESTPLAWIQTSQGVDLATTQSFAIDGDVWLGTQDGQIIKLTSGRMAPFAVTGLAEPFSAAITLFTKPELQNLYVLEPAKSRVVVLNKQGQFIKEIKSSELAAASAVVASERYQKAFALSGSLVYELGL